MLNYNVLFALYIPAANGLIKTDLPPTFEVRPTG